VTAFSRETSKKVYVQHRLKERAKEVNELLEKKAYFYVCGDAANMAREVNTVLAKILSEERGISEAKAEEIVKNMRAANQYQVRGRACPGRGVAPTGLYPCCRHSANFSYRRMSGHKGGVSNGRSWIWNVLAASLHTGRKHCTVDGLRSYSPGAL